MCTVSERARLSANGDASSRGCFLCRLRIIPWMNTVKYCNARTRLAIIRVPRDHYRVACASLTFVRTVDRRPCAVDVLDVCGRFV